MKDKFIFTFLIASAFLGACSSTPKQAPIFSESFVATTTETGLKQFNFSITLNNQGEQRKRRGPPPGGRNGTGPQSSGGPRGRGGPSGAPGQNEVRNMRKKMSANPNALIKERLDQLLTSTAYCSGGYFVITEEINSREGHIFGECKFTKTKKN